MANCVCSIQNVSLSKSITLGKSHSYMRIAILTKISYNDTKNIFIDIFDLSESTSLKHLLDDDGLG